MYKLTQEQYYKLADTADMMIDHDGFNSPDQLKRLIDECRDRINAVLLHVKGQAE